MEHELLLALPFRGKVFIILHTSTVNSPYSEHHLQQQNVHYMERLTIWRDGFKNKVKNRFQTKCSLYGDVHYIEYYTTYGEFTVYCGQEASRRLFVCAILVRDIAIWHIRSAGGNLLVAI